MGKFTEQIDGSYPFCHPRWGEHGFARETEVSETRFIPVGQQLAVRPDPPMSLLEKGSPLKLPDNVAADRPVSGVVLRHGTHANKVEFPLGCRVVFDSRSGLEWSEDGEKLLVIGSHEILGVMTHAPD